MILIGFVYTVILALLQALARLTSMRHVVGTLLERGWNVVGTRLEWANGLEGSFLERWGTTDQPPYRDVGSLLVAGSCHTCLVFVNGSFFSTSW